MPRGLDKLKHIVVLMMENRSFDHMLGGLTAFDPRIDGLTGSQFNLDTTGKQVLAEPLAKFQGQLNPDPDHHFAAVDLQIFDGDASAHRVPTMKGFVKSYFNQQHDVKQSRKIMYAFAPAKLPVLSNLALEFAVFNSWFASIPGPTLCNRAFAHYGTSFGHVGMELWYANKQIKSMYERMLDEGLTSKLYYFDQASSSLEVVNLLRDQPRIFGTYPQFLKDCADGTLPDYSFVEPNYSDHEGDAGALVANDQHPDHHVGEGERFIASVYNAIRQNPVLWESTALLVTYDEHGGIFDHVPPPACTPDQFFAQPDKTGTGQPFFFDRLGVRVPAILISPWIPKGTVVGGRTFEHASIPATVTDFFIGSFDARSPREKDAETFLDLLSLTEMRTDAPLFRLS
ncbi:MAG: alkaline phosphatase family protein [Vicinamibacterales bacterium]